MLSPWLALPAALSLVWLAADAGVVARGLSAPGLWSAAWPLLLAAALALLFWRRGRSAFPPYAALSRIRHLEENLQGWPLVGVGWLFALAAFLGALLLF